MGYSLDKLLDMYDNNEIHFELQSRFNESFEYLKVKEDKYCNCKISNFILTNYKKYKLFDTQNHPSGIIGSYISNEICKHLDITLMDIDFFSQQDSNIMSLQWPDSLYMKNELEIDYIQDNSNSEYYKNLLILIYNNPTLVK
jgi:hypothetical protein